MWYAYAIADLEAGAQGEWPAGLRPGVVVTPLVVSAGLWVVASDVPDTLFLPAEPGSGERGPEDPAWVAEAAMAHHEVVAAAHGYGNVLPLQFGTVFRNETEMKAHFAQIERELRYRLATIRGAEEVEVVMEGEGTPGAQLRVWSDLEMECEPVIRGVFVRAGNTRAYLVERGTKQLFEFVERQRAEEGKLRLAVTGVWPPYSFAGGDLVVGKDEPVAEMAAVAAEIEANAVLARP
jgi:hypothetical protein